MIQDIRFEWVGSAMVNNQTKLCGMWHLHPQQCFFQAPCVVWWVTLGNHGGTVLFSRHDTYTASKWRRAKENRGYKTIAVDEVGKLWPNAEEQFASGYAMYKLTVGVDDGSN